MNTLRRRLRKIEERLAPKVESRVVIRYVGPGSEKLPQPAEDEIDENTTVVTVQYVGSDGRPV